jgi:large subunit ribosomal protein L6
MSRIGKIPVTIPKGVTVNLSSDELSMKGPKGELKQSISHTVEVSQDGDDICVKPSGNSRLAKAMYGTMQRLIKNMVIGVTEGFSKELEIQGTGYRAEMKGKDCVLKLGFSHDVIYPAPDGITIKTPEPTSIVIEGADKQKVGQVAAEIRAYRKPEPYKGKGVRYKGEWIRRKAGKAGKK